VNRPADATPAAAPAARPAADVKVSARPKAARVAAPLSSRAETASPTPRDVIPDGCNLGVVLRVLLGVNAALVLVALAGADSLG
jgi:hypothetical protein